MSAIQLILISIVAFLHFYFMILEMFFWDKPRGMKAFGTTKEVAKASKPLAANMGLYNGFLAAGLVWSLLDKNYGNQIAIFFLSCVIIAGLYGAYSTKNKRILFVQAFPATLALAFTAMNFIS